MPRLPQPCLMLLTDRSLPPPNWTLAQAVAPVVTGGVNLVAFREGDLPAGPRRTVARFVRDAIRGRCPWLVSDDAALAMEIGADGVLLEAEDAPVAEVRATLGPNRLLGVLLRAPEAAQPAEQVGADFGLVLFDWSDPARHETILSRLRAFRSAVGMPLVVGVDMPPERVGACRAEGANGVALCAAVLQAEDRASVARAYTL